MSSLLLRTSLSLLLFLLALSAALSASLGFVFATAPARDAAGTVQGYRGLVATPGVSSAAGQNPAATRIPLASGNFPAGASVTPTCVAVNPTWTVEATIPAPGRYNAAGVTAADGKFYVVGGLDSNNVAVANTDAFDPSTNFWDSYAPLAQARGNPAIGRLGSQIFVTGGNLTGSTLSAANDIYNTNTNSWSPSTDAPVAFTGAMGWGSELTGRYYVFGGNTGPNTVSTQTLIFNPHTAAWQTGAPMPAPKTFGASAGWGNLIYLYGGADATGISDTLFEYDPAADSWIVRSHGPRPRFKPGMSARNGKLYITGGGTNPNNPYEPSGSVDVFDIASMTWTTTSNMLYSRVGQVQGTLNDGRIIVATGIITTSFRTRTTETLPPGEPCVALPQALPRALPQALLRASLPVQLPPIAPRREWLP